LTLMETLRSCASAAPAGTFQQRLIWPFSASISLWLSFVPMLVLSPPSEASSLERLAPPPDGFSLLSSAATSSALNCFSSDFGLLACLTSGFSASLRSGVLAVSACGGFGRASGDGAELGRLVASASGVSATIVSATGSGFTSSLG